MLWKRNVFVTRDVGVCDRVRSRLEQAGIPTWVRTGSFASMGRSHGIPGIDAGAAYEYCVMVRRKDYQAADELLNR